MYYIFWYLQKAFDFLWFINKYLKKVSKKVSTACIPDASIIVKRGHVRAFASRTPATTHCVGPCAWRTDWAHAQQWREGPNVNGKEPFLSATQSGCCCFLGPVASRQKWLLLFSIPGFSHPHGGFLTAAALPGTLQVWPNKGRGIKSPTGLKSGTLDTRGGSYTEERP